MNLPLAWSLLLCGLFGTIEIKLFNEACLMASRIAEKSAALLTSFLKANYENPNPSCATLQSRWIMSSDNFVKVNFDTAIFEELNCMGIRVVIRDAVVDFLVAFAVQALLLLDAKLLKLLLLARLCI